MKELTLQTLIEDLRTGKTTSAKLVKSYLRRIKKYDTVLNAVAELNPDALKIAKAMDLEALQTGFRSPMHGIPILIKDNINTHDSMHTTANSFALADLLAPYDATIVEKLRAAGAVILGKANLSEFAYFMSYDKMPSGFGSRNGQVKNPYDFRIDPLGSSTGSAVALAANMIPVAIGTETNGSLMAPAYQNSVVAIKPTFGMVSRYGIIPIAIHQDIAGPMARTVADCAILLDILQGADARDAYTAEPPMNQKPYAKAIDRPVHGKRIGILKLSRYVYDPEEQAILDEAKSKFEAMGVRVETVEVESYKFNNTASMLVEFKQGLNEYLKTVQGSTKMTSLADIIEFNKVHRERCLQYGQSILEAAQKTSGDLNDSEYEAFRIKEWNEANLFERLMAERQIDALISTIWTSYAPIAGNPSICVPAKALNDLKPRSIILVGKKWDDATLIALAHAYEQATRHRIPPQLDKLILKRED